MPNQNEELSLKITRYISFREAQAEEDFIKQITPKWWQWCIERGGIFKFIAKYIIRIIVIERRGN